MVGGTGWFTVKVDCRAFASTWVGSRVDFRAFASVWVDGCGGVRGLDVALRDVAGLSATVTVVNSVHSGIWMILLMCDERSVATSFRSGSGLLPRPGETIISGPGSRGPVRIKRMFFRFG